MTAYLPALIWLLSAFICLYIAKIRRVKPTPFWAIMVAFFGPLTIPMIFFAKQEQLTETN